jgi:surface protein
MIKVIKYATTGSADNARRKGNFLVGESTVSYGPTSTTGFYNGIEPPEGGYTLYLNKETGGPSIYVFTGGTELLNFCNNNLSADQTTVFGVIDWINGQNDYFVDPNYFEFTVKTDNAGATSSNQFRLPLVSSGSINFTVDWGDNTTDTITTFNQAQVTHTYSSAGTYTVKIAGIIKGWQFNNGGDRLKFLQVKNWGCLNISVNNGFNGCSNMTCTAVDSPRITTTSLQNYFLNCSVFNGAIGNWDISTVTNLQSTFQSCSVFNQSINNWNTSNVTTIQNLFSACSVFNQPLNKWNTSNVTNMQAVFGGFFGLGSAVKFNQDIGSWNTAKVTNMLGMFVNATDFNNGGSPSINEWNTSNVTNIGEIFRGTKFNQPIGKWNVSKITSLALVFNGTPFNQDIGSWDVSNVTSMADMFLFAGSFNNGGSPSINNWNTSKVTNMFRMLYHCGLNQPIQNWDTSNVTNMSDMFRACPLNQPIGSWDISKVTTFSAAWWSAPNFDQDLGPWNPISVTNFSNFMANRSKQLSPANMDSIYNSWSTKAVKSNLSISFSGSKYTSAGAAGRAILVNDFGWTIVDGGQV